MVHTAQPSTSSPDQPVYLLGIDTGGTYTDAVVVSEAAGSDDFIVVSSAKALTTRHDLAIGIGEAVAGVMGDVPPSRIALVSMSTTLATNALVEAHGGMVCLVSGCVTVPELDRVGLRDALGDDPLISLVGGHNSHGDEVASLDLGELDAAIAGLSLDSLTGFAVVAQFGVRNPAHELAVRKRLRETCDVPVTCSHELTAKLNGPKRAVTSVLNARLIGLITELIGSTEEMMATVGITAPLMVVRGDGSLLSSAVAIDRPIETILSGPAASVVGARFLTGALDAVVSDIGGTTTDVAILTGGEPRVRSEGAVVGGHETMVEAVDIRTVGLGGDSQVWQDDSGPSSVLRLGPRRVVPVALLATQFPELVKPTLERQLNEPTPRWLSGCFAQLARGIPSMIGRSPIAIDLIGSLADGPRPLRDIVATNRHEVVLDALVAEGVILRAGFTPTDACHVLGIHDSFDGNAAMMAAELVARVQDRRGERLAASAVEISERVFDLVVRRSAEVVLSAAFERDGFAAGLEHHPLTARALDGPAGLVGLSLHLDAALIGLGASARTYYPHVAERLGATAVLSEHADVANAIGAVVGRVRIAAAGSITRRKNGQFNAHGGDSTTGFANLADAAAHVEQALRRLVADRAERAGAAGVDIVITRKDNVVRADGADVFVDSAITAVARGRPRLGMT